MEQENKVNQDSTEGSAGSQSSESVENTQTMEAIDESELQNAASGEDDATETEGIDDAPDSQDLTMEENTGASAETEEHAKMEFAQEQTAQKKTYGKKPLIITAAILAVILIPLICFAVYVNNYDKVYPNIYVADVNFGGKTAEETTTLLHNLYTSEKVAGHKLDLICKESKSEILMDNMSISFDNEKTASEVYAAGRDGNLFQKVYGFAVQLMGKREIKPELEYDDYALQGSFDDIALPYETEPVGFTYSVETNKLTIYQPHNGIKADRKTATNQVIDEIRTLRFGEVILEPVDTPPEPLDLDAFYKDITKDAVNAYYEKAEDGHVEAMPERLKCDIDLASVQSAIQEIKNGAESFAMAAVTTPPEVTKEVLESTLYSESLGSYTTNFGGSTAARANNVRLAAANMNGKELMPGEVFSYNNVVGPRTAKNGFLSAPVYVGNKVESGLGGGVCQPSSTLYSAVLYANLEIVERSPHSMAVGYMPGGMDATVSYGTLDLQFKNSTDYPVKIVAVTDGGSLTCKILGYNPEKYSVEIARSSSGRTFYVTRIVYKDGVEVKREQMSSSTYQEHEKPEATAKPSR